ncbi:hypothetical protein PTRA_a1244 [Pseudoalteromonas translucida KMM 520]|uniref:Uncharacterized protein n=1 Tax=Pseudoalteromonas translucida KMM 520 TaxID=1315283 RepID=A0A0U2WW09_9GAMM|nr:hypothetical protein PTRA_a1244 [Pseudoalteromonas translucida KMM 520]
MPRAIQERINNIDNKNTVIFKFHFNLGDRKLAENGLN